MELPGYVCCGATSVDSDQFFFFFSKLTDLGGSKRAVQPFSSELFFVFAIHALDCEKILDVYETFFMNITRSHGRDVVRRKDFYITCDLNVELVFLCTDEDDVKKLNDMYGPLIWKESDTDQGGFQ